MTPSTSECSQQRVPFRRLVLLCAASLLAGIGVATLRSQDSPSYGGSLQARTIAVLTERDARVETILFAPGQRVAPGDKLAQLADERLTAQIENKRRELVELAAELKRVQAAADVELEWRSRDINGEIFQTQLKLSSVGQERTSRQVEQLAWQDQLKGPRDELQTSEASASLLPVRSAFVDGPLPNDRRLQAILKEDAAAGAVEALTEQLQLCEERLERLKALEQQLAGKVRTSAGVDLVEARIDRARQELADLEKQQESLTITSPGYGIIGSLQHRSGDRVAAGDPILELLDDDRRFLIANIPSSTAAKVPTGARITLVFPNHQERQGIVSSIPPRAIPADPNRPTEDSMVEVRIEPSGKLWPQLPIGSRVQVQVQ